MDVQRKQGRCEFYGWDVLSMVLIGLGVVTCAFKGIGLGIGIPLIGFGVFRVSSKKISERQQEEVVFQQFLSSVKGFFCNIDKTKINKGKNEKNNKGKNKSYTIVICPRCFHRLRVPENKGVIKICCPVCSEKFREKT